MSIVPYIVLLIKKDDTYSYKQWHIDILNTEYAQCDNKCYYYDTDFTDVGMGIAIRHDA